MRLPTNELRALLAATSRGPFRYSSAETHRTVASKARRRRVNDSAHLSDNVRGQLESLATDVEADACSQILSSPLRRCLVTHLTLPKLLMFQIVSVVSKSTPKAPQIALAGLEGELKEEVDRLRKRTKRRIQTRFLRREGVRNVEAGLLRAINVLKNKVATSITDESRSRFQERMKNMQNLMAMLKKPYKQAHIGIDGILMPAAEHLRDVDLSKVRFKRGLWCSLQRGAANKLVDRDMSKRMETNSKVPSDILTIISSQLSERVFQELNLLSKRVHAMQSSQAAEVGWLIKRVRQSDLRQYMIAQQNLQGPHRLQEITKGTIAALLRSCRPGHDAVPDGDGSAATFPQYDFEGFFADDEQKEQFRLHLGEIGRALRKRARSAKRNDAGQGGAESKVEAQADIKLGRIETGREQSPPSTWPRLYLVRQHQLTTGLCIALWRLQEWHLSSLAMQD